MIQTTAPTVDGWEKPIVDFFKRMRWNSSFTYMTGVLYTPDSPISFDTEAYSFRTSNGSPRAYTYGATFALGDPVVEDAVRVMTRTQEETAAVIDLLIRCARKAASHIKASRDEYWVKFGRKKAVHKLRQQCEKQDESHRSLTEDKINRIQESTENPNPFKIQLKVYVHNLSYDISYLRNFLTEEGDINIINCLSERYVDEAVFEVLRTYGLEYIEPVVTLPSDMVDPSSKNTGTYPRYFLPSDKSSQLWVESRSVQHITIYDRVAYLRVFKYMTDRVDRVKAVRKLGESHDDIAEILSTPSPFSLGVALTTAKELGYLDDMTYTCSYSDINRMTGESYTPFEIDTSASVSFVDTAILAQKTLAELSKDYPDSCRKSVTVNEFGRVIEADLDYSKPRHAKTRLTHLESQYMFQDVMAVNHYITTERMVTREGKPLKWSKRRSLGDLEITATQKIRKLAREKTLSNKNYKARIKECVLTEPEQYHKVMAAFSGGFTHANRDCVERLITNVDHTDFTSSYPFVLLTERFPMGSPQEFTGIMGHEDWEVICQDPAQAAIAMVKLVNVRVKDGVKDSPLPATEWRPDDKGRNGCIIMDRHGKRNRSHADLNNGRVMSCDSYWKRATSVDWSIWTKALDFDDYEISDVLVWKTDYLPLPLIEVILDLYAKKTTLKGVIESVVEYAISKGYLNSTYGMMVSRELRSRVYLKGNKLVNHKLTEDEVAGKISDIYNPSKNKGRFLYTPWGVFCTAYARRNLWMGIIACGEYFVYTDTDSIFYKVPDDPADRGRLEAWFKWYNTIYVRAKIEGVIRAHSKLTYAMFEPCTITGKKKTIGVWDFEPHCDHFKTDGAKRYVEFRMNKDGIKCFYATIAGADKGEATEELNRHYQKKLAEGVPESEAVKDTFERFTTDPEGRYGRFTLEDVKLNSLYLGEGSDLSCDDDIKDDDGNIMHCKQKYGQALFTSDYSMTLPQDLYDYLILNTLGHDEYR